MGKKRRTRQYLVGVDLGGTKVLIALIDEKGHVTAERKMPTEAEQGAERVVSRIAKAARAVIKETGISDKEILAIGVGAPGPLNPETGVILNAPNLPGWRDVPLAKMLEKETGLPTFIENDVNAGIYGESRWGVGRGVKDIVGIFVGTGVGGGLIVGGKLRSGYRHVAAEVGHIIVLADGPTCGCGNKGCLEALASRTAIVRDIMFGIQSGRPSVIAELSAGKIENVTSGVLVEAARRGDALTLEVLGRAQYYLGILVADVVNFFDPEMVILGGGVIEAFGDDFLRPIRQTALNCFIAKHESEQVKIVSAKLGDYAGVLGAAMLAAERTKKAARRKVE